MKVLTKTRDQLDLQNYEKRDEEYDETNLRALFDVPNDQDILPSKLELGQHIDQRDD